MNESFAPYIQDRLDAPLPPGVTREAMLAQTVVASLHLSRADLWTVPKQSVVEVHMPITLSLMMTNVLTGEVLFVENLSTNVQGLMPLRGYEAEAAAQFPERFNEALSNLINAAAARFQPNAITGTVRGRAGRYFVFDVGRRGGLREGDQIGVDANVVFADAEYSILEPALGNLSVGQSLSRQIAQPVENLARPSMLVVVAGSPEGIAPAYLKSVMEDALGDASGFTIAPVNASLSQIREPALTTAGVSGRLRELPDYFLRLSVATLDPIETDTNVSGVRRRVQEARAFVEIINHEGRVVFATQGKDQRIDEIVGGMAPATDQRRDAAVRNAIFQAATSLATTFRPARLRLDARSSGDEVRIADEGGVLSPGVDLLVIRRTGRVPSVSGEVWAPVAEIEVQSSDGREAVAIHTGVDAPRIQSGDQVAYEAAGPGARSRRVFSQCYRDGRPSISTRGTITQPLFDQIAVNSFASGFSGAVQIATFHEELAAFGLEGHFRDVQGLGALRPPTAEVCFEPVHQVNSTGERVDRQRYLIGTYDVTIGYTLRQGENRLAGGGLQQELSATAVPVSESSEYRNRSIQIDLAEVASQLSLRAARDLTPPP